MYLVLSDDVLKHFERYKQLNRTDKESGGQLFARLSGSEAIIVKATGPRFLDKRTRTSYTPNRRAEQREIKRMFGEGLHYIGDWHTHPTAIPFPSSTDKSSVQSCFVASSHELTAFVLIIVGTDRFPRGLSVSLQSKSGEITLKNKEFSETSLAHV